MNVAGPLLSLAAGDSAQGAIERPQLDLLREAAIRFAPGGLKGSACSVGREMTILTAGISASILRMASSPSNADVRAD